MLLLEGALDATRWPLAERLKEGLRGGSDPPDTDNFLDDEDLDMSDGERTGSLALDAGGFSLDEVDELARDDWRDATLDEFLDDSGDVLALRKSVLSDDRDSCSDGERDGIGACDGDRDLMLCSDGERDCGVWMVNDRVRSPVEGFRAGDLENE